MNCAWETSKIDERNYGTTNNKQQREAGFATAAQAGRSIFEPDRRMSMAKTQVPRVSSLSPAEYDAYRLESAARRNFLRKGAALAGGAAATGVGLAQAAPLP